jgi:hypothetical protein
MKFKAKEQEDFPSPARCGLTGEHGRSSGFVEKRHLRPTSSGVGLRPAGHKRKIISWRRWPVLPGSFSLGSKRL